MRVRGLCADPMGWCGFYLVSMPSSFRIPTGTRGGGALYGTWENTDSSLAGRRGCSVRIPVWGISATLALMLGIVARMQIQEILNQIVLPDNLSAQVLYLEVAIDLPGFYGLYILSVVLQVSEGEEFVSYPIP